MNIVKYPTDILNQNMPSFDFDNPIVDPKTLQDQMLETMHKNKGIGLAAPQVNINTRMFVIGFDGKLGAGIFNPVITKAENITEDLEGCLSFPGIFVKIKRPSFIEAKWQNYKGEWQEGTFENYLCKCFLHEYDHLEGIVFKDRVSSLKWSLGLKKSKKGNY